MNAECFDLVIIGAGPAGMAAAVEACSHGLRVALLDEQASPGGQIYRNVLHTDAQRAAILGPDYVSGQALVDAFLASSTHYIAEAAVWQVTAQKAVHFLNNGVAKVIQGRTLLLATGAYERPMPIPGWTLPGVMTAGAGQILLKSAALLPNGPVVLAGCGPLLYLLAVQYLRAGIRPAAVVDTSGHGDLLRGAAHLPGILRGWRDLGKGLGLLGTLRRLKIAHYRAARDLSIEGESQARALCFTRNGRHHRIPAELILLHQGVVPNTQISNALRLDHDWDNAQHCWTARRSQWGETSLEGVFIAGDGGRIGGALAARQQGRLAALAVARQLQSIEPQQLREREGDCRKRLAMHLALRPLLDRLYPPSPQCRAPADDVIICRCEEVRAKDIRAIVALGCLGPNQTKAFSRCGMGPCQGRMCGLSVTELIASERQVTPEHVGYYRIRPPLKPITLAQLASETPVTHRLEAP